MTHSPLPPEAPTAGSPGTALAGAVVTHSRRWLAAAHALTGDRHSAEDLLQTVLVATLSCRPALARDTGATDAYVRRALRNEHISAWRRRRRRAECLVAQLPEPEAATTEAARLAQRDELWALVKSLPRAQRAAVVLRFYEDMTEAQTAQALGCSIGAVKSNTSRGLQRLRRQLRAESPGRPPSGHAVA